jgi:hypothetical protein
MLQVLYRKRREERELSRSGAERNSSIAVRETLCIHVSSLNVLSVGRLLHF